MSVMNIGGPGSVDVGVKIELDDLRNKLLQAGHPLGNAPQWNGDKVWLVGIYPENDEISPQVSVMKAKTKELAEEVAVANMKTRGGPEWKATATEVIFGSKQLLATIRVST